MSMKVFNVLLLACTLALLTFARAQACCLSDEPPLDPNFCNGVSERTALEAFYDAANGDGWTNNSGWKSELPLDQWFGYDGDYILHLPNNNLTGTIAPEVFCLPIRVLLLRDNELEGSIPVEIGLSQIKHLLLERNNLTGSLPSTMHLSNSLQYVYLQENNFCGPLTELGNITSLHEAHLECNFFCGILPISLVGHPSLFEVHFECNSPGLEVPYEDYLDDLRNGIREDLRPASLKAIPNLDLAGSGTTCELTWPERPTETPEPCLCDDVDCDDCNRCSDFYCFFELDPDSNGCYVNPEEDCTGDNVIVVEAPEGCVEFGCPPDTTCDLCLEFQALGLATCLLADGTPVAAQRSEAGAEACTARGGEYITDCTDINGCENFSCTECLECDGFVFGDPITGDLECNDTPVGDGLPLECQNIPGCQEQEICEACETCANTDPGFLTCVTPIPETPFVDITCVAAANAVELCEGELIDCVDQCDTPITPPEVTCDDVTDCVNSAQPDTIPNEPYGEGYCAPPTEFEGFCAPIDGAACDAIFGEMYLPEDVEPCDPLAPTCEQCHSCANRGLGYIYSEVEAFCWPIDDIEAKAAERGALFTTDCLATPLECPPPPPVCDTEFCSAEVVGFEIVCLGPDNVYTIVETEEECILADGRIVDIARVCEEEGCLEPIGGACLIPDTCFMCEDCLSLNSTEVIPCLYTDEDVGAAVYECLPLIDEDGRTAFDQCYDDFEGELVNCYNEEDECRELPTLEPTCPENEPVCEADPSPYETYEVDGIVNCVTPEGEICMSVAEMLDGLCERNFGIAQECPQDPDCDQCYECQNEGMLYVSTPFDNFCIWNDEAGLAIIAEQNGVIVNCEDTCEPQPELSCEDDCLPCLETHGLTGYLCDDTCSSEVCPPEFGERIVSVYHCATECGYTDLDCADCQTCLAPGYEHQVYCVLPIGSQCVMDEAACDELGGVAITECPEGEDEECEPPVVQQCNEEPEEEEEDPPCDEEACYECVHCKCGDHFCATPDGTDYGCYDECCPLNMIEYEDCIYDYGCPVEWVFPCNDGLLCEIQDLGTCYIQDEDTLEWEGICVDDEESCDNLGGEYIAEPSAVIPHCCLPGDPDCLPDCLDKFVLPFDCSVCQYYAKFGYSVCAGRLGLTWPFRDEKFCQDIGGYVIPCEYLDPIGEEEYAIPCEDWVDISCGECHMCEYGGDGEGGDGVMCHTETEDVCTGTEDLCFAIGGIPVDCDSIPGCTTGFSNECPCTELCDSPYTMTCRVPKILRIPDIPDIYEAVPTAGESEQIGNEQWPLIENVTAFLEFDINAQPTEDDYEYYRRAYRAAGHLEDDIYDALSDSGVSEASSDAAAEPEIDDDENKEEEEEVNEEEQAPVVQTLCDHCDDDEPVPDPEPEPEPEPDTDDSECSETESCSLGCDSDYNYPCVTSIYQCFLMGGEPLLPDFISFCNETAAPGDCVQCEECTADSECGERFYDPHNPEDPCTDDAGSDVIGDCGLIEDCGGKNGSCARCNECYAMGMKYCMEEAEEEECGDDDDVINNHHVSVQGGGGHGGNGGHSEPAECEDYLKQVCSDDCVESCQSECAEYCPTGDPICLRHCMNECKEDCCHEFACDCECLSEDGLEECLADCDSVDSDCIAECTGECCLKKTHVCVDEEECYCICGIGCYLLEDNSEDRSECADNCVKEHCCEELYCNMPCLRDDTDYHDCLADCQELDSEDIGICEIDCAEEFCCTDYSESESDSDCDSDIYHCRSECRSDEVEIPETDCDEVGGTCGHVLRADCSDYSECAEDDELLCATGIRNYCVETEEECEFLGGMIVDGVILGCVTPPPES